MLGLSMKENEGSEIVEVAQTGLSTLCTIMENLFALEQDRNVSRDSIERKKFMETFRSKCIECINLPKPVIDNIRNPEVSDETVSTANLLMSDQKQVTLNRDDAITVLSSLKKASQSSLSGKYSAKDTNAILDRKLSMLPSFHNLYHLTKAKNLLSSSSSDKTGGRRDGPGSNTGTKRPREPPDDETDRCFYCDRLGHRRRDDNSPSTSITNQDETHRWSEA